MPRRVSRAANAASAVIYSAKKGRETSVELPNMVAKAVSVTNAFVRINNGGEKWDKPKKGEQFDLAAENVHVFWVLDIEGYNDKYYIQGLEQLNAKKGFEQCIEVNGDKAQFKAGAKITVSGGEVMFTIQ